jgi:UDP-3-O-[3-hydroxymyristoyl] glucosamine N-acyltransferase
MITPTLGELVAHINGQCSGDMSTLILGASGLEEAEHTHISFLSNPVYYSKISQTRAAAVLVKEDAVLPPTNPHTAIIKCKDPYLAFCMILDRFFNPFEKKQGVEQPSFISPGVVVPTTCYIGAFAYIDSGVKLGENVQIYPHTFIGKDTQIGANTLLYAGVKVYPGTVIGNDCIVHAGAVIGSDGFGHAPMPDGSYAKIPQIGKVILEDRVEIGANTTVDRATLGETKIEEGCKLDNLIQIGHNVHIGKNTVIAAQSGVAGSTSIGFGCMVGGQVGFAGHLKIANKTRYGAQTGVATHVKKEGTDWLGTPAMPYKQHLKSFVVLKELPQLEERVRNLEKQSQQHTPPSQD